MIGLAARPWALLFTCVRHRSTGGIVGVALHKYLPCSRTGRPSGMNWLVGFTQREMAFGIRIFIIVSKILFIIDGGQGLAQSLDNARCPQWDTCSPLHLGKDVIEKEMHIDMNMPAEVPRLGFSTVM